MSDHVALVAEEREGQPMKEPRYEGPLTSEMLEQIPCSDEEVDIFVGSIKRLIDHMDRAHVPQVDLLWSIAVLRVGFTFGILAGLPEQQLLQLVAFAAKAMPPNAEPPLVPDMPPREECADALAAYTQRMAFIAGSFQRKYKHVTSDMVGWLLHVYATRMSYYGAPVALTMQTAEDCLKETHERIARQGAAKGTS